MAKSKFEMAMEELEKGTPQEEEPTAPKRYVLKPEPKNAHLSLMIRKSTRAALEQIREEQGIKLNQLCNDILESFIDNWERGKH